MTKISRNSPCPCGSGLKFKRCCGSSTRAQPGASLSTRGKTLDSHEGKPKPTEERESVRLGLSYLMGTGIPADPARGLALIEQAAQAGDAEGVYLAATIAATSFWRERNWDAAFDYLLRAAQQGHEPAQSSLRILAGGPTDELIDGDDWAGMCSQIDLAAWFAPPEIQMIRETPRVQLIEKFVPASACKWLIGQAQGRLSRATIYDNSTGGTTEDGRRTNSECELGIDACGVLTFVIRGRIAAVTQRQDLAMEVPKILYYVPGETFAEHYDYLNPAEPAYANELAVRGQRTDTFLIYLNDDFSGGETHFPLLGITHTGATGDALLFSNVDAAGVPDPDTKHTGLSTTSGEKWVFSQWIRELPR